jgi:hypothetical protein
MKKLIIAFAAVILTLGASAQRGYHGGNRGGYHGRPVYRGRSSVRISAGLGYYSNPFYSPYYYGSPGYYSYSRPSRLSLEIEDIKADYKDKIWSARHDKSLSRSERKKTIHDLKSERDNEIREAERTYYRR